MRPFAAAVLSSALAGLCAARPQQVLQAFSNVKVPVILGVMSRCPDAILCEGVFDQVLDAVGDKVDISLSFLGKANSTEPSGVSCLHGRQECTGNIQELCVAKYAPDAWWRLVICLDNLGKERIGTEEGLVQCAKTVDLDLDQSGISQCISGPEGASLLQASVRQSEQLGIRSSCTILINGAVRCVHDGTWKECNGGYEVSDFVESINEEYDALNPKSVDSLSSL
ncbi:hypothetical protein BOTBODRAFT_158124 [Botryobasidium botryosum FD-172 SS1]|uniref:Gamma interferon inducible lysosomal thiol reductase n=1 Tax=Botryobasidium botryosum (strain FD-172 SS1) TaxID=930990 RepID=A0A067MU36_BOTB1|nr:hypothetical protein BOTBODRAFT_158124 [Botryobasidium botryosum FD-172 SS1]